MNSDYQKADDANAAAPTQPVVVATPAQNVAPAVVAGQTEIPVATPAYNPAANPAPYNPQAVAAPNGGQNLPVTPDLEMPIYQITTMGNRSFLHKIFVLISIFAGLTGVNSFIAQAIALAFEGSPAMEVVLRCYAMALYVVVVLTEAEKTTPIRQSFILMNWTSRGFFYTFLGVLGMVQYDVGVNNYYSRRYNNNSSYQYGGSSYHTGSHYMFRIPTREEAAEWYVWLVACLMVFMGLIYMLMGFFCMQKKLDQLRANYQNGKTVTVRR